MLITPTMTGTIASGSVCWGVFWNIINHIESIPIFGRFIKKEKIYNWVNRNKILTISCTEVLNLSVHGISSPLGPMMALGGTLVNSIVIFILIPFRQHKRHKLEQRGMILGV